MSDNNSNIQTHPDGSPSLYREGQGGSGSLHSLESFGTVDGPGIRFVAFFQGCPMRCQFCHNPDTWDANQKAKYEWTPEQLLDEVKKYKNFIKKGGVTCTGGEPLMQADFVLAFFKLCKEAGIHTALDTSGVIFNDKVKEVLEYTDLVLLDIKTLDDSIHKEYTGCLRDNNQKFLDYLESIGKPTWIRHVVVPGITDNDERLTDVAKHIARYTCIERVEVLPYHTMGKYKYQELGIPYPLEGVEDLSEERKNNAVKIFEAHVNCQIYA